MSPIELAAQNLLSPPVLFFALGLLAALARSDLTIPDPVAKVLALYLMMAIGFKGGVEVAASGLDGRMLAAMAVGIVLSAAIPLVAYGALRLTSRLRAVDAAAVSAHYGSISIVTFVAASETLRTLDLRYEGWLVAVAAVMETPAIVTGLILARRALAKRPAGEVATERSTGEIAREVALNASVVMLVGAFVIGWITGPKGLSTIAPFIVDPFRGVLCLFLLDMGLVAGRGMRQGLKSLSPPALAFGIYMPLVSAAIAAVPAMFLGLSPGGTAMIITLAASASYIAVPAAMRLALPEASPSIYLTLSLAVTFPFNLTVGIPLYLALAKMLA